MSRRDTFKECIESIKADEDLQEFWLTFQILLTGGFSAVAITSALELWTDNTILLDATKDTPFMPGNIVGFLQEMGMKQNDAGFFVFLFGLIYFLQCTDLVEDRSKLRLTRE